MHRLRTEEMKVVVGGDALSNANFQLFISEMEAIGAATLVPLGLLGIAMSVDCDSIVGAVIAIAGITTGIFLGVDSLRREGSVCSSPDFSCSTSTYYYYY